MVGSIKDLTEGSFTRSRERHDIARALRHGGAGRNSSEREDSGLAGRPGLTGSDRFFHLDHRGN